MKLQRGKTNQFTLTIPVKLVEAKGWEQGQELKFRFNERGNLEIEEVRMKTQSRKDKENDDWDDIRKTINNFNMKAIDSITEDPKGSKRKFKEVND